MCFTNKNFKLPKVATKDINCYKIVEISNSTIKRSKNGEFLLIPYYNYNKRFRYKLGNIHKINNSTLKLGTSKPSYSGEVFHSFSNKKCLNTRLHHWSDGTYAINVKCTIPKGSLYLYNSTNQEYVSDQIRIDYIMLEYVNFKYSGNKLINILKRCGLVIS